jgi:hypothetical protein
MKTPLKYINDDYGKTKAVQMLLTDWKKVLGRLKKYEHALKLKSDLQIAFRQVAALKKTKVNKQTLKEWLTKPVISQ